MRQTAVFVDAGYLHAQGSALLVGSAQRRERNRLNVPLVIADLIAEAAAIESTARLLRIYWYDGIARGGLLSQEQAALAQSDNVKCRFGTINSRGQQKGVDSLIVTDLIQLAREQAFSDALIMSGDEDVRVGVQVAQTFGIRVHLLGVHPARGSQSPDLLAEADTTRAWGKEKIAAWLTIVPSEPSLGTDAATGKPRSEADDAQTSTLHGLAAELVGELTGAQVADLLAYADQNRGQLPADFDRPTLARARHVLERDLTFEERRDYREAVRHALRTQGKGE